MAEVLCTTQFDSPIGRLRIVSSPKGVVYVGLPKASGRGFEGWRKTRARDSEVVERRTGQEDAIDQILEFLAGERRQFEIDLDLRATPFQLDVYKVVAKVGYGKTCSYLDIAEALDNPKAVRAVGAANGANPIPLIIPCHRVIASNGTLQGYAGGLTMKKKLLAMESPLDAPSARQARLF